MGMLSSEPFIANGTIQPSKVVKLDTTAGKLFNVIVSVLATDSGQIGVAQPGSYDAPGVAGALPDAARAGLPLMVYGVGEVCLVHVSNTAAVVAGALLAVDAVNGQVNGTPDGSVTTAIAGNYVIAVALEPANPQEKVRAQVIKFKI
jgi:hypothetical protein